MTNSGKARTIKLMWHPNPHCERYFLLRDAGLCMIDILPLRSPIWYHFPRRGRFPSFIAEKPIRSVAKFSRSMWYVGIIDLGTEDSASFRMAEAMKEKAVPQFMAKLLAVKSWIIHPTLFISVNLLDPLQLLDNISSRARYVHAFPFPRFLLILNNGEPWWNVASYRKVVRA